MRIDENAYYLVDVSYTKGIVAEGQRKGEKHTAERTLFNIIENEFRTKAEAKRHMERNGFKALKERKIEKYSTTATGRMMIEDRKRFGIKKNEENKIDVNAEKVGWVAISGFDLLLYFAEVWGFER